MLSYDQTAKHTCDAFEKGEILPKAKSRSGIESVKLESTLSFESTFLVDPSRWLELCSVWTPHCRISCHFEVAPSNDLHQWSDLLLLLVHEATDVAGTNSWTVRNLIILDDLPTYKIALRAKLLMHK